MRRATVTGDGPEAVVQGREPTTVDERGSGLRFDRVETDGTCLDLHLPAGAVVALVGPSGGARRRLLLAAAGLRAPDAGRVLLHGRPPGPTDAGVLDEDHLLIGGLTAAENVAARAFTSGSLTDDEWAAIPGRLATLGLPEAGAHNLAEQLSGGQQQRVAVARALFGAPPLLCLDDPTSELDGDSAQLVWAALTAAAADGAVVLVGLATPDPASSVDRLIEVG